MNFWRPWGWPVNFPIPRLFQAQMSRVGAMTEKQMAGLTARARELGRDTKFTAVEVGQGMEYLTMAGFNARQTVQSIGGVLDLGLTVSRIWAIAVIVLTCAFSLWKCPRE